MIPYRFLSVAVALALVVSPFGGCRRHHLRAAKRAEKSEKPAAPPFETTSAPPAPPAFDLTAEETQRLLFPGNFSKPDPEAARCVPLGREGPAPRWLDDAVSSMACTDAAREALKTGGGAPAASSDLLTAAALCDDAAAARRLVAAGASANRRDSCGWTALVAAASTGHASVVDALLEGGAKANLESHAGRWSRSPLVAALARNDATIVRALLEAGADPRRATPGGRDALMFAAMTGDSALVERMLHHKADACREDARGMTALEIARAYGGKRVASVIAKAAKKCSHRKDRS